MPVYLVRVTVTVPVVARDAEHAHEVALQHLHQELEAAEVDADEITGAAPAGYEDVLPWGDESNATLAQRRGGQ